MKSASAWPHRVAGRPRHLCSIAIERRAGASKEQTAVAQKQIATTLQLERLRAARESFAFHAMFETRDEPVANSNSGNGNLRPETFDCARRQ